MNILVAGPVGSGKTTQAKILASELELKLIKTGDLVRNKAKENSPEGVLAQNAINSGGLANFQLVAKLIKDELEKDTEKGVIFDAYPRSLEELKIFDPHIDKVVFINISDQEAEKRLTTRKRSDDDPDTIEKRLEVFHKKTTPLINFYKNQNKLIEVDGSGTEEEVTQKVKLHISELI